MAQRLMLESPNDLLTRGQAARILGVRTNTLAVWACNKRYALPYVKVGSAREVQAAGPHRIHRTVCCCSQ